MKKVLSYVAPALVVVMVLTMIWLSRSRRHDAGVVRIGAIIPLTGPVAVFGEWIRDGLTMAVEDANANAIEGFRLELIVEDSENKPARGIAAANKLLTTDSVDVLVAAMSGVAIPLFAVAEQAKVPLLLQDVTYPGVTERSPWVLRHFVQSDREAELMVSFLADELPEGASAVMFFVNDDAGIGARAEFSTRAEQLGWTVREAAFQPTERDHRPTLASLLSEAPDLVYIFGNGPSWAAAIRQLKELGFGGVVATNAAMMIPSFRDLAGADNLDGVLFTGPYFSGDEEGYATAREFAERYRERFGVPPAMEARYAWDLISFLVRARQLGPIENPQDWLSRLEGLEGVGAAGPFRVQRNRDVRTALGVFRYSSDNWQLLRESRPVDD